MANIISEERLKLIELYQEEGQFQRIESEIADIQQKLGDKPHSAKDSAKLLYLQSIQQKNQGNLGVQKQNLLKALTMSEKIDEVFEQKKLKLKIFSELYFCFFQLNQFKKSEEILVFLLSYSQKNSIEYYKYKADLSILQFQQFIQHNEQTKENNKENNQENIDKKVEKKKLVDQMISDLNDCIEFKKNYGGFQSQKEKLVQIYKSQLNLLIIAQFLTKKQEVMKLFQELKFNVIELILMKSGQFKQQIIFYFELLNLLQIMFYFYQKVKKYGKSQQILDEFEEIVCRLQRIQIDDFLTQQKIHQQVQLLQCLRQKQKFTRQKY